GVSRAGPGGPVAGNVARAPRLERRVRLGRRRRNPAARCPTHVNRGKREALRGRGTGPTMRALIFPETRARMNANIGWALAAIAAAMAWLQYGWRGLALVVSAMV